MTKRYLIHCDFCSKRVIVQDAKGLANLNEISQAAIPGGVPFLDLETQKIKQKKSLPRRKLLKCPNCGRGLILRKDTTILPEIKEEKPIEEEDHWTRRETGPFGHQVSIDPP